MSDLLDFKNQDFNIKNFVNSIVSPNEEPEIIENSLSSEILKLQIYSEDIFNTIEDLIDRCNTSLPKIVKFLLLLKRFKKSHCYR